MNRRQRLRRARERGASLFIIVLVMSMLATVGIFAASGANLATAASGGARQSTQSHYLAEYALLAAASELSGTSVEAYLRTMASPASSLFCEAQDPASTSGTRSCYVFHRAALEATSGKQFFIPATPTGFGSLGPMGVDADFSVEMTDLAPATVPVPGSDLSRTGPANVTYMSVTLTSRAQMLITSTGIPTSLHATRAHLIVGPVPASF